MEDSPNPPLAEDGSPAPDDASAPDEQPANPSTPDSMPAPDDASGASAGAQDAVEDAEAGPREAQAQPRSVGSGEATTAGAPLATPSPAAAPRWQRVGAGMGALGALLVLCGALLPTYSSGDYEGVALKHAPLFLVGLLIAPSLMLLGISVWAWFNKPSLWLVVPGCLIIILAFPVHWFGSALFTSFACFDVCPPGGIHYGTGFWLPLLGFPLAGIGIVFAAIASAQQPKQAMPAA